MNRSYKSVVDARAPILIRWRESDTAASDGGVQRFSDWHIASSQANSEVVQDETGEDCHAGAGDHATGQTRCARREVAVDAGGRVRERRDGSYPGGQTWSAIDQAGNCHWAFEGEARGSEIAGTGIGGDAQESGTGYESGKKSAQSFCQAFAGYKKRAKARRAFRGIARGAFATGEEERSLAREGRTQPDGEEGSHYSGAASCVGAGYSSFFSGSFGSGFSMGLRGSI
jgi:hypothetical protein